MLIGFLDEAGVLALLPEDSNHEDIDEAARLLIHWGTMPRDQLNEQILAARDDRQQRQQSRLLSLVDSLNSVESEYERSELEARARRLAVVEALLARVGIPSDLVVPLAGLLQAADCNVSEWDSPDHVRKTIHRAAKRLLESIPE